VSGGNDDEYEVEHVLSDGELWFGCAVDDGVLWMWDGEHGGVCGGFGERNGGGMFGCIDEIWDGIKAMMR
jgi:hypothetical protein